MRQSQVSLNKVSWILTLDETEEKSKNVIKSGLLACWKNLVSSQSQLSLIFKMRLWDWDETNARIDWRYKSWLDDACDEEEKGDQLTNQQKKSSESAEKSADSKNMERM